MKKRLRAALEFIRRLRAELRTRKPWGRRKGGVDWYFIARLRQIWWFWQTRKSEGTKFNVTPSIPGSGWVTPDFVNETTRALDAIAKKEYGKHESAGSKNAGTKNGRIA